jgi:hypothetical protein
MNLDEVARLKAERDTYRELAIDIYQFESGPTLPREQIEFRIDAEAMHKLQRKGVV